jgi:biopolymer transport protein ExbD
MKFYARKRRMPTVIIVSLIDIFAILLIFVIVTSTFRRDQPNVVIKLPESKAATSGKSPQDPMTLTISKEEQMFLDGKPVTTETLRLALENSLARSPNRPLALNADTKASFGFIIKVLDILKDAGVKNIPAFTESK